MKKINKIKKLACYGVSIILFFVYFIILIRGMDYSGAEESYIRFYITGELPVYEGKGVVDKN